MSQVKNNQVVSEKQSYFGHLQSIWGVGQLPRAFSSSWPFGRIIISRDRIVAKHLFFIKAHSVTKNQIYDLKVHYQGKIGRGISFKVKSQEGKETRAFFTIAKYNKGSRNVTFSETLSDFGWKFSEAKFRDWFEEGYW